MLAVPAPCSTGMSPDQGEVFAVADDENGEPHVKDPNSQTPNSFLNSLSAGKSHDLLHNSKSPPAAGANPAATPVSPVFMVPSMENVPEEAQDFVAAAKERAQNIRPWREFFSFDQFHVPESATMAHSRFHHNLSHFQNNYLIIVLLTSLFSL